MEGGFLGGLVVGLLLGLMLGPVLHAWLVWREVESMRRESHLSEALLKRLDGTNGSIDVDDTSPS